MDAIEQQTINTLRDEFFAVITAEDWTAIETRAGADVRAELEKHRTGDLDAASIHALLVTKIPRLEILRLGNELTPTTRRALLRLLGAIPT